WSPDGTQIIYSYICGGENPAQWRPDPERTDVRERTSNVFLYDFATGESQELIPGDGVHQDYAGDWHPDGDRIVIYSDRVSDTFNFYFYDLAAEELTQITTFTQNMSASRVSFDPAGEYLLYNRRIVANDIIRFEVRAYNLSTDEEIPVASGFTPNWSPDGAWIAYATEGDVADIFLLPATCVYNGGGCDPETDARNVTQSPAIYEREPVFSPDQTQLLYVRDADDGPGTLTWDLFRHDLRTGLLDNLTETALVSERHRTWEPVPVDAVTPVETVLPVVVRVSTNEGAANIRASAAVNGELVGVLQTGTLLVVQGANADRTWFRITLPEDGSEAWIYYTLIVPVAGDLNAVPQVQ
ncbi:MAG: hypothetical protein K8S97_16030, partial [Anaerolineae bacterium]|nr:hypothetical protein [Anaerolineae bacterium]